VELGIDTGDYTHNKKIFDMLIKEKEKIEEEIKENLEWSSLELRRMSRIMIYYPQTITIEEVAEDPQVKQKIINWCIDIIKKFKQVFTPRVQKLRIQ